MSASASKFSAGSKKGKKLDWTAVGFRLRIVRQVLGLSEIAAADAFGVKISTYHSYELGRRPRDSKGIVDFADKFDVSLEYLFFGETAAVGAHLTKRSGTRVSILPACGRRYRTQEVTKSNW